jgi:hypothetical protein
MRRRSLANGSTKTGVVRASMDAPAHRIVAVLVERAGAVWTTDEE